MRRQGVCQQISYDKHKKKYLFLLIYEMRAKSSLRVTYYKFKIVREICSTEECMVFLIISVEASVVNFV